MTKPSPSADALFARRSLVEQIADDLRTSIQRGTWKHYLPPERALCRLIDASRPITRKAIHLLRDEGLLRITRGHPTEIVRNSVRRSPQQRKRVAMLAGVPLHALGQWHLMVIDEIRKELNNRDCHFEYVADLRLRRKHPDNVLRTLIGQYDASHWILYSMPSAVQTWFQEKRLHATLMGHAFPGISFSSVDEDTRALTRHAMGVLLGLGHRRICFLSKLAGAAGDAAAELGFAEAVRGRPDADCRIERHSGEVDQIRSRLRRIFSSDRKPTGLVVSNAMDTLVVLTWLMGAGIRMPRDVSLISLETQSFLDRITPSVARYEGDPLDFSRHICRLVTRTGTKCMAVRLIPGFQRNATIDAPPQPPA